MTKEEIEKLQLAYQKSCEASTDLENALFPFFEKSPNMFSSHLKSLGTSNKLCMARDFLNLFVDKKEEIKKDYIE